MSQESSCTCDGCGNDLSISSNIEDYRLALVNQAVPHGPGMATCMGAYPALKRDIHFCGINCLRIWLDKTYPADKGPYHDAKCWASYQRKQREKGEPRQWL